MKAVASVRPDSPTLDFEQALLRGCPEGSWLAGIDEVGRGAWAGPVAVGVVAVSRDTGDPPPGLADSKLLDSKARASLLLEIGKWSPHSSVGFAAAFEIDRLGLTPCLRLAALRALARLQVPISRLLLDGPHDYLGAFRPKVVTTSVKADRHCAAVAAASILAKVARDRVMAGLDTRLAGYGFDTNFGYGTSRHRQSLAHLGPTAEHRLSWRLPGVSLVARALRPAGSQAGPELAHCDRANSAAIS